ncbi:GspE/PulE family protein [Candidatus Neomarinimicrobiota bacterium]
MKIEMIIERDKIGQMLLNEGVIDKDQLKEALLYKTNNNVYLGKALESLKMATSDQIIQTVSEQLKIPWVNPLDYKISKDTLKLIKEESCRELNVIPLFHFDDQVTIACSDQNNIYVVDELAEETVLEINIVLATDQNIRKSIDLHYNIDGLKDEKDTTSHAINIDIEIIEAVNMLLEAAINMSASDIHIEPREKDVRVRFRVDGMLSEYYTLPRKSLLSIISRIKILSGMNIAVTRQSQDGRFRYKFEDKTADIRCASFPTPIGEKMVMRILDISKGIITLENLGFSKTMLKNWDKVVNEQHGLILVTGPTGSGKSTTLYATLNIINSVAVNILTVEDPIEYQLENINQSQINEKANVTFSSSLRAMLRLDPDIIMVGEMRDRETIELAIRASLTGHLVLSTLHTNDSASAYTRILNMGVDAFLITSTVRAILAQRLIRRLCPKCKKSVKPTVAEQKKLKLPEDFKGNLFKPVGCLECRGTGYAGRAGVYELLIPNEEISALVNERSTSKEIEEIARKNGMITLNESARQYVIDGTTSIEEMIRISLV